MRIQVTQEDIDQARGFGEHRPRCMFCPVAHALYRATGRLVEVYQGRVFFCLSDMTTFGVLLPGQVDDFIRDFDAGWTARPIEFELDLPVGVVSSEPTST